MPPELKSALLYKAHRAELVDYANGIVRNRARAEDVVQDAWERMQTAERAKEIAEPLRYFYRIVRNLALDCQRALGREALRSGPDIADVAEIITDSTPSPDIDVAARQELRIVLECIEALPERSRIALTLHAIDGWKLREIAAHLGLSVTYVHGLIADAKIQCIRRLSKMP